MSETLQEFVDSRGVAMRVDCRQGVIRGVKVLGLRSRNGRTYLAEALASAVSLYEGAKVNVNHPRANPLGPRDYQDRIGNLRNVSVRAGEGLFADFHFNPKHALAEQLLINPNTVARAYRELETAGLVEKRRTAGTYVTEARSPLRRQERLKILGERVYALLAEARQMDVSTEEVIQLVRRRDKHLTSRSKEQ